jgi:hypothetical protein
LKVGKTSQRQSAWPCGGVVTALVFDMVATKGPRFDPGQGRFFLPEEFSFLLHGISSFAPDSGRQRAVKPSEW